MRIWLPYQTRIQPRAPSTPRTGPGSQLVASFPSTASAGSDAPVDGSAFVCTTVVIAVVDAGHDPGDEPGARLTSTSRQPIMDGVARVVTRTYRMSGTGFSALYSSHCSSLALPVNRTSSVSVPAAVRTVTRWSVAPAVSW